MPFVRGVMASVCVVKVLICVHLLSVSRRLKRVAECFCDFVKVLSGRREGSSAGDPTSNMAV